MVQNGLSRPVVYKNPIYRLRIHRTMGEYEPMGCLIDWDEKSDDWLAGWCAARGTVWYDHMYDRVEQHVDDDYNVVYTWDEPGEEQ